MGRAPPYEFFDGNITKVETLIETVGYIHNNPVRRGLVQTAGQWRYSGARTWERAGMGPLAVDRNSFPMF